MSTPAHLIPPMGGHIVTRAADAIKRALGVGGPRPQVTVGAPILVKGDGTAMSNAEQMERFGITSEQAGAYKGPLSEAAYAAIEPYSYATHNMNVAESKRTLSNSRPAEFLKALVGVDVPDARTDGKRDDAWRMYLGMPQQEGTFEVSPYRPSSSQDPDAIYYRTARLWNRQGLSPATEGDQWGRDAARSQVQQLLRDIEYKRELGQKHIQSDAAVMGQFTMGAGKDDRGPYISYYDRWDLDANPVEGEKGRIGKPYEIYDRLYYDPQTYDPLPARQMGQAIARAARNR